jgi:hypothetical protein
MDATSMDAPRPPAPAPGRSVPSEGIVELGSNPTRDCDSMQDGILGSTPQPHAAGPKRAMQVPKTFYAVLVNRPLAPAQ